MEKDWLAWLVQSGSRGVWRSWRWRSEEPPGWSRAVLESADGLRKTVEVTDPPRTFHTSLRGSSPTAYESWLEMNPVRLKTRTYELEGWRQDLQAYLYREVV